MCTRRDRVRWASGRGRTAFVDSSWKSPVWVQIYCELTFCFSSGEKRIEKKRTEGESKRKCIEKRRKDEATKDKKDEKNSRKEIRRKEKEEKNKQK